MSDVEKAAEARPARGNPPPPVRRAFTHRKVTVGPTTDWGRKRKARSRTKPKAVDKKKRAKRRQAKASKKRNRR